eukprot:CAMPEP_0118670370 /NCGR_PEP_ID=MMETSP0785-20121206/21425_1 /TAXON_ID=91992 /ORGANISM="Bolidomonas pacifica, Strain CCMP 1866" /LENGTH=38 /DNA_ID= /DNA_START= /DNA_END= /DNA_ORIENTATION=
MIDLSPYPVGPLVLFAMPFLASPFSPSDSDDEDEEELT